MRNYILHLTVLASLIIGCSGQKHEMEPVGIGSGGDIVDTFLRAARQSVVGTLRDLTRGARVESLCRCAAGERPDSFCRLMRVLTAEQTRFCIEFARTTAPRILQLNTTDPVTPLVLTTKALLQPDSTDVLRPVIAMTSLGEKGSITFQYDRVQSLSPMEMLAVLGHELGHKVALPGGRYIDDNFPVGPFGFDEGGRFFLDVLGAALARHAAQGGLVSQTAGMEDRFTCTITAGEGAPAFVSSGRSARQFLDPALSTYETGIGNLPGDFKCRMKLVGSDSATLDFRVIIHEARACQAAQTGERWTRLELWREVPDSKGGLARATKLRSIQLPDRNPVCARDGKQPIVLSHRIDEREYRFEIGYGGTVIARRAERWRLKQDLR